MEFCPKCKTLMLPSKKTATCPRCGARIKAEKSDVMIKEKIVHSAKEKFHKKAPKEIEATMPLVDAECEKCGNKKAYWWVTQTSSGLGGSGEDELETEFFRCTKCKYTWRKSS